MFNLLFYILILSRTTIVYIAKRLFCNIDCQLALTGAKDEDLNLDDNMDNKCPTGKKRRQDETDATTILGTYATEDKHVPRPTLSVKLSVHKDALVYNMNHKERGKCVILNHDSFDEYVPKRDGSDVDVEAIKRTFKLLDFTVVEHQNLSFSEIYTEIENLSKENHSERDCICVFILTHGSRNGLIHAKDQLYPLETISTLFTADKCLTLAGKPKLFFIQACRGSDLDDGIRVRMQSYYSETDSAVTTINYKIPTHADFLFGYSTVEGYKAWRDPLSGSWYIQVLCKVLETYWETFDLMKILTITAREIANEYESDHDDLDKRGQKQIPTLISMLTREVVFSKKKM